MRGVLLAATLAAAALTASGRSAAQTPQQADRRAAPLAVFEIARGGDAMVVPVRIGGRDYPFLVDTGATHCVADRALRPLLGEVQGRRTISTSGPKVQVEVFKMPAARLGPLPVEGDGFLVCLDLTEFREVLGREVRGVLGMDFLRRYVLSIDPDRGRLALLATGASAPRGAVTVPLTIDRAGSPLVRATIGDAGERLLLVDTGADDTSLSAGLFDGLAEQGGLQPTGDRLILTAGGELREPRGRLRELRLGTFRHAGLIVGRGAGIRSRIGLTLLARYRATFDFPARKLYLQPGARHQAVEHPDRSGLYLVKRDGRVLVDLIDPGSAAAAADLRPGDVLQSLDGRAAADLSLFSIRRLFRAEAGKRIQLRLLRDGRRLAVPLELAEGKPQ